MTTIHLSYIHLLKGKQATQVVGLSFYNNDGNGSEIGGTIQVAKENGDNNTAGYMRFCTRIQTPQMWWSYEDREWWRCFDFSDKRKYQQCRSLFSCSRLTTTQEVAILSG